MLQVKNDVVRIQNGNRPETNDPDFETDPSQSRNHRATRGKQSRRNDRGSCLKLQSLFCERLDLNDERRGGDGTSVSTSSMYSKVSAAMCRLVRPVRRRGDRQTPVVCRGHEKGCRPSNCWVAPLCSAAIHTLGRRRCPELRQSTRSTPQIGAPSVWIATEQNRCV